jgi:hypothetical protein
MADFPPCTFRVKLSMCKQANSPNLPVAVQPSPLRSQPTSCATALSDPELDPSSIAADQLNLLRKKRSLVRQTQAQLQEMKLQADQLERDNIILRTRMYATHRHLLQKAIDQQRHMYVHISIAN